MCGMESLSFLPKASRVLPMFASLRLSSRKVLPGKMMHVPANTCFSGYIISNAMFIGTFHLREDLTFSHYNRI